MGARIWLPLRVLLPCVAACLVASGAAAVGVAGIQAAGSSVMRQADDALRACASIMLSHGADGLEYISAPFRVPSDGACDLS